jgi:8-amino-7-oxononanoate synthase
MMTSLDNFAKDKLGALETKFLRRELTITQRKKGGDCTRNGKSLISFCCNDYLGLSHHKDVINAAQNAAEEYGAGSGASQLITGHSPLLQRLEKNMAEFKRTEACAIFSSGYMANIGIIPCFIGPKDIIFIDQYAHACLWQAALITDAKTVTFHHNNLSHLEKLIQKYRKNHPRAMILTDGIFSMDGDIAPLPELSSLAANHDIWLHCDDAHGLGVVGGGKGSAHHFTSSTNIDLQMGSFSKAAGSFGGYLCASKDVVDLIKTRARSFVFTTALPPASLGASLEALKIIKSQKSLCLKPVENANIFTKALGLPAAISPIVPLIIGQSHSALAASKKLEELGFLVSAIRPPTVPEDTARLRFTFSALHNEKDILKLCSVIKKLDLLKGRETTS